MSQWTRLRGSTNDEFSANEQDFLLHDSSLNKNLPSLNGLRAFEVSARYLSFSKAAEELHVTPAAISQQVRLLEQQLGITLFHRRVRALELTEAGRAALPHFSEGFNRLQSGVDAMRLAQHVDYLTVSVAPSIGARWLVPRLERLRTAHPEFDIRIDAKHGLANFTNDGVDVAIRYGMGDYRPHISECILAANAFPVCSPKLLNPSLSLSCPDDLAGFTLLHSSWTDDSNSAPGWRMWLKAAGATRVNPEPGPRLGSDNMLVEAALAAQGVALVSQAVVARELDSGKLVRPFPPAVFEETAFAYFLVYPERHRLTPKVIAFRNWIFAEIGEDIC